MGICMSTESSEIHEAPKEANDENAIVFQASKVVSGTHRLCSVYSKKGSKGLNQDAAILCQVGLLY